MEKKLRNAGSRSRLKPSAKRPARSTTSNKKNQSLSPAPSPGRAETRSTYESNFSIVGIGASAGGLEAFEQFFTHMAADSGMAFVLIPHLAPDDSPCDRGHHREIEVKGPALETSDRGA